VRFSFRGFHRETGDPQNGQVEAPNEEAAYQILSDHEIVTETLHEYEAPDVSLTAIPDFEEALNSALDLSSSQVPFDALS
jgi:hypothetical protein